MTLHRSPHSLFYERISSQRDNYVELCCFIYCHSKLHKQTIELLEIWYAMTLIWRHCDDKERCTFPAEITYLDWSLLSTTRYKSVHCDSQGVGLTETHTLSVTTHSWLLCIVALCMIFFSSSHRGTIWSKTLIDTIDSYSISQEICTRLLICCALLWLYIDWFSNIHQAYFTGTVAI